MRAFDCKIYSLLQDTHFYSIQFLFKFKVAVVDL